MQKPKRQPKLVKKAVDTVKEAKHLQAAAIVSSPGKVKLPRGRPQEHTEARTKVTVILLDRQIAWLDHLALNIRAKTKAAMSRAEIIRAMVSAMEDSSIDLSDVRSETELRGVILTCLRK